MDMLTMSEQKLLDEDGYPALEGIVELNCVKAMRTRLEALLADRINADRIKTLTESEARLGRGSLPIQSIYSAAK